MPATVAAALRLSPAQARAAVLAAQGLAGDPLGGVGAVLERAGFLRTLGGVEVYLAMRARLPGMRRADLDSAVASGVARVTPAVRGCIYLVSGRQQPLCLALAARLSKKRDEREQEKAGMRKGEAEKVAKQVAATLAERGPLSTSDLKKALPDGVVRSLGDQGKKVGLSSNLPPALRWLEFAGEVERILEGGRVDTERYLWRRTATNPFTGAAIPDDPAELHARFAEVFFRAAGIGTRQAFAGWAGISQKNAQAAIDRLDLVPVTLAGSDETHFALDDACDLVADPPPLRAPALLPFEDNTVALHDGPALLVDPVHHDLPVPTWGRSGETPLRNAAHASLRTVVAGGAIVGFWEYDPDGAAVVALPLAGKLSREVGDAARALARFVRDELGHGRSFSLDSDDELRRRAGTLRGAAGAQAFPA
jgi:hypothetical protein